jgi:hypothetical protein
MASVVAQAQRIVVVGVKKVADCEFALRPLKSNLAAVPFPSNWTIALVCNRVVWGELQRKADALATNTGFTNLKGRITVINAEIYTQLPPLQGTVHATPRLVLQHERGHILCGCEDESKAERAAGGADE